nr:MAG: nucleotide modification associated domain 1 [Bacteriophage sp.]
MKYKYLKGSAEDFDGHPGAILVVKSESTGRVYHLGLDYAGRDKDIEKVGDIIIAHRELEPDPWMLFESPTGRLITERGSRYGKFKDGAEIMQSLKDTMRDVDGWNNLTASQKEALDMIQHKIGRILNGDPTYDDSWKDIAGYATLIVNELNGEVK